MHYNKLTTAEIEKIFDKFKKDIPHPVTELRYNNEFELLIAVMLSAQTLDLRVNMVTEKLFKIANTPKKMLRLTFEELSSCIQSIGLFNTKARNILAASKVLINRFNSKLPKTRVELESLPGVGRKTANVLLNTLWGIPTIAVDTHVLRVANRIGLVNTSAPLETESELLKIIPQKYLINAHNWLILHGRYVCKAIKPLCETCLIKNICRMKIY